MKMKPSIFLATAIVLFIAAGNLAYTADMTGGGFAIAGGLSILSAAIVSQGADTSAG